MDSSFKLSTILQDKGKRQRGTFMATDQASDEHGEESFLAALMRRFLRWWRREPSSREETVEVPGLPQQPPREPVGQVFTHEGHPEFAVVDLGRDISDALRPSWDAGHAFESGGLIQSLWLQPLFCHRHHGRVVPARRLTFSLRRPIPPR